MRDDHDRSRPLAQQPGEVVDPGRVQVVRRLVEQQHVRALGDPAREPHAVALADAQGVERALGVARGAEPGQRLVDAPVGVPRRELLVAGHRRGQRTQVAALVVEPRDRLLEAGGHGTHGRARRGDERPDGVPGRDHELLVDDRERACAAHRARGRHEVAGQDPQQRRLARTVLADQPDALTRGDGQVEPVQHGPTGVPERHGVGDELHRTCRAARRPATRVVTRRHQPPGRASRSPSARARRPGRARGTPDRGG
ncbi:hypothetical protein CPER28S_03045 [Cellulomonas persica]